MLPAPRAQKLSTQMNVELVMCQEVFGQHADRMVNPVYGMSLNETFPSTFLLLKGFPICR
jgi:hypothetical protein